MWPSVLPLLAGAVLRMIRGVKTNGSKQAGLGLFRATGIYVGAILGSGILVLPAIAAKEAGPASLLAWALLLVFCTPVAFSFAEMSRQQPDAGGIAHFVTRAYGRRASAVAGYLFYFAIPFGAPAAAVNGGSYIAHALGGGRGTALAAAGLLPTVAFAGNAVGIRMSSGIQLVLMVLLVGQSALLLLRRLGGGHASRGRIPPPRPGPQTGHLAHPGRSRRGLPWRRRRLLHGRDGVWPARRDSFAARPDAGVVRRYGGRRCDAGGAAVQRLGARGPAGAGRGRRLGRPPRRPECAAVRRRSGNVNYCGAVGDGAGGGGAAGDGACCAASCPARTVASIIEVMNRVAISSSSGVNSAIAAAMWRASGWNMAPPSR